MKLPWYWKAGIAVLALAFAYLVWPTPWRYEHHAGLLVRIDRLRGNTDVLRGQGWERWQPPRPTIEEALAEIRRKGATEGPSPTSLADRARRALERGTSSSRDAQDPFDAEPPSP